MTGSAVAVYLGEALNRYAFGSDHPFCESRVHAFTDEMHRRHLDYQVRVLDPVSARREDVLRFHTAEYVDKVQAASRTGEGFLDYGDTPAVPGIYEAALSVVGSVLDATRRVVGGEFQRVFIPVAGMHHSMPDSAAGFCIFNDVGVAIRELLDVHGLQRIAYVDIDAHHGDGLYYPFESDPRVIFADVHEDGRYVYPRSGFAHETGLGKARGCKLNIPLLPRSGDEEFEAVWPGVMHFLDRWAPQFVFMQCGADGLYADPLAHLQYSPSVHRRVATDLCELAHRHAGGRLVAVGGGGYHLRNVGRAWATVVETFLEAP